MPVYQESGLTVSLADDNHFRFCDCRTYQKLSGSYLKEMDFGWWNAEKGCLYLMELKDFSSLTADEQLADKFIEDIILCVVDCLLMLSAIWTNSEKGQSLHADLTQTCPAFSRQLCRGLHLRNFVPIDFPAFLSWKFFTAIALQVLHCLCPL